MKITTSKFSSSALENCMPSYILTKIKNFILNSEEAANILYHLKQNSQMEIWEGGYNALQFYKKLQEFPTYLKAAYNHLEVIKMLNHSNYFTSIETNFVVTQELKDMNNTPDQPLEFLINQDLTPVNNEIEVLDQDEIETKLLESSSSEEFEILNPSSEEFEILDLPLNTENIFLKKNLSKIKNCNNSITLSKHYHRISQSSELNSAYSDKMNELTNLAPRRSLNKSQRQIKINV